MESARLTPDRIDSYICPAGKQQAFFWDTQAPGLGVRVTSAGAKSFIFESKLRRRTIRITLGDVRTRVLTSVWSGKGDERTEVQVGVREEANRLRTLIEQGKDPRQVKADEVATEQSKRENDAAAVVASEQATRRNQITVGEVWAQYVANPPKRKGKSWGNLHKRDHEKVIAGATTKGTRTLTGGVLACLAPLPLSALTSERVGKWLEQETPSRGTQAALAFRLLRAFINWCETKPEYRGIASSDACARNVSKEHLKTAIPKEDALQRAQLRLWFDAVRSIQNTTISALLQGLLITGARRNELSSLRWEDVDFRWNSLTIRDKVSGTRTIPLTPYFAGLLRDLKSKNETKPNVRRLNTLREAGKEWEPSPWVFSSPTSKTGRLEEPSIAHRKAIAAAGLPPVSLHGLRRSFGSLTEWCEVPNGIVAQIMGHKPSATAEKHYRVRPLELLHMWHVKIETWMLEQAGIESPSVQQGLQLVANTAA